MNRIKQTKTLLLSLIVTLLLSGLNAVAVSTTVTITCTGTVGSFNSGSVNGAGTKNDGNLTSISNTGNRGWATFDLSSIPQNAPVTSAVINFTTYTSNGSGGSKDIYGFIGNATSMPGTSLFSNCVAGTSFSSSTWAGSSTQSTILNSSGMGFIASNEGSIINLGFVNSNTSLSNIYNIYGYGANSPTLTITYDEPVCVTPLNPGNTVCSIDSACTNTVFGLSLQNTLVGTGISYQWQQSNNVSFTSLSAFGSSSSTVSTQQSSPKYYRCRVRCNNGTDFFSTPVYVPEPFIFYKCYCIVSPNIGGVNDIITNVTMGTLNNTSTYSLTAPPYFTSYNNTPVSITSGTSQSISITMGNQAVQHSAVWIDFDHDGTFSSIEQVATSTSGAINNAIINYSLAIPINASLGITRMRVRGGSNSSYATSGACNSSQYGETEDYLVDIYDCLGTPNPGNTIASANPACANDSITFSLQNASLGSGITYQWYNNLGLIAGATNATYKTLLTVGNTFYCEVKCGTAIGTSTSLQVTMNIWQNCYCASRSLSNSNLTEQIGNVTIKGNSTNTTYSYANHCTNVAPGVGSLLYRYANFTPLGSLVTMNRGETIPFSVTNITCWDPNFLSTFDYIHIWIDFNKNGSFIDVGEKVYTSALLELYSQDITSGTFTIPMSVICGETRMRVILSNQGAGANISPCVEYTFGETEDYLVTIDGANNYETASACNFYYWPIDGQTYYSSGVYTYTNVSNGCTDTSTLNLTIINPITNYHFEVSCNSYFWPIDGITYTNSGLYYFYWLDPATGCMNTEVLDLTINPFNNMIESITACQSYFWGIDGNTYNQSGSYNYVNGCDTYTLNLVITNGPILPVNTINISTGVDDNGNVLNVGVLDPNWKLYSNNIVPQNANDAAMVTYHYGWGASSNSSFISFDSSPGYPTIITTPDYYNFKFKRPFSTCSDDTLLFNLNLMFDNFMNGIYIDGVLIPNTISPNNQIYYQGFHNYNFTKFLSSGVHTLEINVINTPIVSNYNPQGLNVQGDITSNYSSLVSSMSSASCSCNPCTPPSNLQTNSMANSNSSATATWDALPNVSLYYFKFKPVNSLSWANGTTVYDSIPIYNLLPCTTYEFCVCVPCANNTFSTWVCDTFTTGGVTHSKIDTAICSAFLWTSNNTVYSASGTYTNTGSNPNGCPKYDTLILNIIGNVAIPLCPLNDSICSFITGDSVAYCSDSVHLIANTTTNIFNTTAYTVAPKACENCVNWRGSHPVIVNTDDIWSGVIDMPFEFCYFGNKYNKFIIGANGQVGFDISLANQYNAWASASWVAPFNNSSMNNCIMSPFHDIDPGVAYPGKLISWEVYGTAPCRYMVVSWDSIPMFSCNSLLASQQIVLYESSNIIDINIKNKPLCTNWNSGAAHEGIQNANGTVAYMVSGRNGGQWTTTNDCHRFTPSGPSNFLYEWKDVATGNILSTTANLDYHPTSNGLVSLTSKQVRNCDTIIITCNDTVNVILNNPISIATSSYCSASGSVITYNVTGGTPPYQLVYMMPSLIDSLTGSPNPGQTYAPIAYQLGTYTITITDASGCSNSVTYTMTHVAPPSVAMNFDGVDDYVSIPDAPDLNFVTGNFTFETWAKLGVNLSGGSIVSKRSTSNTSIVDGFLINLSNNSILVQANNAGMQFPVNHIYPIPLLGANVWHHIALTRNGNLFTVYLDGQSVGAFTSAVNITSPSPLLLGNDSPNPNFFNGSLDEVRIWNSSRTQAEILANMNCELDPQGNLRAYYKFNNGAINANNVGITGVTDYSGNGHCGSLFNATLTGSVSNYTDGQVTSCCNTPYPLVELCGNGMDDNCNGQIDENCPSITVGFHLYLQGYYIGNQLMTATLMNQGIGLSNTITDTILVELHETFFPYDKIDSAFALLQTNGNVIATFNIATNNYYYVAIKHRNHIETWSANPIYISASINYDFAPLAAQAYGSNQVQVAPNTFALYSGDINQDSIIDNSDYTLWESDANSFNSGYLSTDLNGDGGVDNGDYIFWEVNSSNFIGVIKP